MASLWGDRFQSTASIPSTYVQRIDTSVNIHDVLATVYDYLPQIHISTLTADKTLGTGSMFHVRHELYDEGLDPPLKYHVAVKYMRTEHNAAKQRQIMRSLLRELRTMTHPMIRGHPNITSAFGYGWTDSTSTNPTPFLVMEYADFGTLSNHLKATQLHTPMPVKARFYLALDVSCGLQALHACGLIHGDVKTSNVLVCGRTWALGYSAPDEYMPYTAKLADFGSSLTKEEANEHVFQYTGTALYNAPEVEVLDCGFTNRGSFIDYKLADVYSFGLLLWEVVHGGNFYLHCLQGDHELLRKKRYSEFLTQIHQGEDNKLLQLAIESLQGSKIEMEDNNQEDCWVFVVEALTLTLRTHAPTRGSADRVYQTLSKGIRYAVSSPK
jgi:serine/threonine protein kinase